MKKIIHEDERIIEILAMFAEEIKTGRVREGEAIDKTACMLTAYMEGVVKARVSDESLLGQQNDTMTPTMEEVAGWHRELSGWFMSIANMSGMACTNDLNRKRAKLWEDRAAHVEAMGWGPIEECPKNGTYIDLWDSSAKKRLTDCRWDGNNRWVRWDENSFGVMAWCVVKGRITHFMAIPQPPVKE